MAGVTLDPYRHLTPEQVAAYHAKRYRRWVRWRRVWRILRPFRR